MLITQCRIWADSNASSHVMDLCSTASVPTPASFKYMDWIRHLA